MANSEPISEASGLPLRQELKEAGFLENEDAQNYLIHYGTTPDTHIKPGMYGDFEVHYCDAPHGKPVECGSCEWEGPHPSTLPRYSYSHECPKCGSDSLYEKD